VRTAFDQLLILREAATVVIALPMLVPAAREHLGNLRDPRPVYQHPRSPGATC
jgi:hypothetical protein